jgi:integrase/recombinase XerD
LTSSFVYVRDWINKHPFQGERDARLICNLYNGAPLRPDAIWEVLEQLRLRIKRLVEGDNLSDQKRQKLEHLLRKRWHPYCFRHSAITSDSDHLPEYAVKKKARWTMNSNQGRRYIKQRMGNELKQKILEHNGINLGQRSPVSVQRTCGKCGYVNKLESKYCERVDCNYPLTQLALDEIKKQEESRLTEIVNERLKESEDRMDKMASEIQFFRNEFMAYVKQYGHRRLTDEERKNVDPMFWWVEVMHTINDE